MARKRKKVVSLRTEQRRRREAVEAIQKDIEQVCQEMAAIMNEPISKSPEAIRLLYERLGFHQRALDKKVGRDRSDEITTRIYNSIVKSQ